MQDRKFGVFSEWSYQGKPEEHYEHCFIAPTTEEQEQYDGDNCVGCGGREGYEFGVYPSLREAIINAHFDPSAIQFKDLTEEEQKAKDELLAKCTWSYKDGLKIKE